MPKKLNPLERSVPYMYTDNASSTWARVIDPLNFTSSPALAVPPCGYYQRPFTVHKLHDIFTLTEMGLPLLLPRFLWLHAAQPLYSLSFLQSRWCRGSGGWEDPSHYDRHCLVLRQPPSPYTALIASNSESVAIWNYLYLAHKLRMRDAGPFCAPNQLAGDNVVLWEHSAVLPKKESFSGENRSAMANVCHGKAEELEGKKANEPIKSSPADCKRCT